MQLAAEEVNEGADEWSGWPDEVSDQGSDESSEDPDFVVIERTRAAVRAAKGSSVGKAVLQQLRGWEALSTAALLMLAEAVLLALQALWLEYETDVVGPFTLASLAFLLLWLLFGWPLHHTVHPYAAPQSIPVQLICLSLALQSSVLWTFVFRDDADVFRKERKLSVADVTQCVPAAAAVVVALGSVAAKVTPLQAMVPALVLPPFYWLADWAIRLRLHAVDDAAGMRLFLFAGAASIGLALFTSPLAALDHPRSRPNRTLAALSSAGTAILLALWPAVAAALAGESRAGVAAINTLFGLCGGLVGAYASSILLGLVAWRTSHIDLRARLRDLRRAALAGPVFVAPWAGLQLLPASAAFGGLVAAAVAVVLLRGPRVFVAGWFRVQDGAGVAYVEGASALLGALAAIIAAATLDSSLFYHGSSQPSYQAAALGVCFASGGFAGLLAGAFMASLRCLFPVSRKDLYTSLPYFRTF